MSDKAQNAGWVVIVVTPRLGGGRPMFEVYDAAIPTKADAEALVSKMVSAGPDTIVEAVAELSSPGIDSIGLKLGAARSR